MEECAVYLPVAPTHGLLLSLEQRESHKTVCSVILCAGSARIQIYTVAGVVNLQGFPTGHVKAPIRTLPRYLKNKQKQFCLWLYKLSLDVPESQATTSASQRCQIKWSLLGKHPKSQNRL